ncbi:gp30 [Listeria phage P40]|uniref:gp30 n=1 Tax=Listeria phage P40 TaxID=560178 RepID=UPI00018198E4|nr:gp30 [Listeria phage P40]ACI00390.1 gp30 [Listeria phage P40]
MSILKKEDLELLAVEEVDRGIALTFLDEEQSEILTVNLTLCVFDEEKKQKPWVADAKKKEDTEKFVLEYFGVPINELETKIGEKYTVYSYVTKGFNDLRYFDLPEKFTLEEEGLEIYTTISKVIDDGKFVHIEYMQEVEGAEPIKRDSKISYSNYVEKLKQYLVDPMVKAKKFAKFEKDYGVTVQEANDTDILVGLPIKVEVQVAFGKFAFGGIKKVLPAVLEKHFTEKKKEKK